MKNIIKISAILTTFIFLWTSCDKIDCPCTEGGSGGATGDTIRKVLLEDFTGHKCVNCPQAHKIAADLQKVYGKQLIVVAIHAGIFAKPKAAPFNNDYRTPEGNSLYSAFGVSSTPIGMVNRVKQPNGGYLVDKGAFATEVSKQIDSLPKEPDVYIELKSTFNSTDSTLKVESTITFLKDLPSGKYNYSIMVIEDDIISAQSNNDPLIGSTPTIPDYHHKHMLRGMLTATLGDEILNAAPSNGQQIKKTYANYKLKNGVVPDNCKIVAFVSYADGPEEYRIIQAEEIDLK
jgi:thiol-disulfide isomerase/thioredoxin